jgi:hypothetical protein
MCNIYPRSLDSVEAGAPAAEIENTPEMIEAGEEIILCDVLEIGGLFEPAELAKKVYLAMSGLDLSRHRQSLEHNRLK